MRMTLEAVYTKSKADYQSRGHGVESWQWIDEGRGYAIMDYLSSCEMTADDWSFAGREGIAELVKEIENETEA